jgi:hypothetical protein
MRDFTRRTLTNSAPSTYRTESRIRLADVTIRSQITRDTVHRYFGTAQTELGCPRTVPLRELAVVQQTWSVRSRSLIQLRIVTNFVTADAQILFYES